jgi:hypothetical protein
MATTRTTNVFAEPISDTEEVIATPAPAPESDQKRARVKGTWTMYWGNKVYDFEEGKSYNIPSDLFTHLKAHGNIYDTL